MRQASPEPNKGKSESYGEGSASRTRAGVRRRARLPRHAAPTGKAAAVQAGTGSASLRGAVEGRPAIASAMQAERTGAIGGGAGACQRVTAAPR